MKVKLKIQKPHVSAKHVKHTAGFSIFAGTLLEACHFLYPSGLIMLGFAGIVAVYEPYFITEHKEVYLRPEEEEEQNEEQI